ncbi:MAG: response regulator [Pedobacter sp.]|nr:MAG: response regulator [Pedobacter sp.]
MKKCIYVVEDNAAIRDMIEFLLIEEQYEVKTCANTGCFWQEMQSHKPDMVILDVMLPDGSGVEICNQLKHNVKTFQIPIIMMSAGNQLSKIKSNCDAEDYINKPFDLNDLVYRIEHHLAS